MPKVTLSIWKVALLLGLLAFSALLWLNDHVGYEAKSALLINAHGENQDEVLASTVAAFAETDTFVQRTLGSSRLQGSAVGQVLESEEQLTVVEQVKVRGGGKKGGLVVITAAHADADVAEVVSTESTETLVRMGRLYLGGEKEFTATVIDQAIVSKSIVEPWLYILETVITTLLLFVGILVLEPIIAWFRQQVGGSTKKIQDGEPDERFVPQKLDPAFLYPEKEEVPAEERAPFQPVQPKASEIIKEEVYGRSEPSAQKTPLQSVSVSMEDLPFTFEGVEEKEEASPQQEEGLPSPEINEPLPADQEPSVLEYKRRLNELLSQK